MNHFLKITRLIVLSGLVIMTSQCKKPKDQQDYYIDTPIAGFTWTGNEGPAPVTVQFVNTSEYSDTYQWDFGDGYSSYESDPQHTYHNTSSEPLSFLVILKATDSASGQFDRKSKTIVIQPGGLPFSFQKR
jgi:hypothetical protein